MTQLNGTRKNNFWQNKPITSKAYNPFFRFSTLKSCSDALMLNVQEFYSGNMKKNPK